MAVQETLATILADLGRVESEILEEKDTKESLNEQAVQVLLDRGTRQEKIIIKTPHFSGMLASYLATPHAPIEIGEVKGSLVLSDNPVADPDFSKAISDGYSIRFIPSEGLFKEEFELFRIRPGLVKNWLDREASVRQMEMAQELLEFIDERLPKSDNDSVDVIDVLEELARTPLPFVLGKNPAKI